MIGVIVRPGEIEATQEYFELFKTPWEFAVPGRSYAAILTTTDVPDGIGAPVILVYGARALDIDRKHGRAVTLRGEGFVRWAGRHLPIYQGRALFDGSTELLQSDSQAADYVGQECGVLRRRIGYELFEEVAHLLRVGQSGEWATTPTLDLHIELLRQLLLESGVPVVDVVPRPAGFDFVCCLTHDVDFFGIARHGLDRTIAGFVWRASLGSLTGLLRRERTFRELLTNWTAVCSLPFAMLGWRKDLWQPFDTFTVADAPHPSTFFLVPFRKQPGAALPGAVPPSERGVAYQASDVADEVREAAAQGREVAVHGINAWCSAEAGRRERLEIEGLTGRRPGVRMHWLYYTEATPQYLERAGFAYDSTWGYNDAVGYRAGTSQVFKLPGTKRLLELPLCIMDSALFFRRRMGVRFEEAREILRTLIGSAREHGGTLVVNWHDRSLAPERLWNRPYTWLLDDLKAGAPVWFATGADAVAWFRLRRGVTFRRHAEGIEIIAPSSGPGLPGLVLRVQRPGRSAEERELGTRELVAAA